MEKKKILLISAIVLVVVLAVIIGIIIMKKPKTTSTVVTDDEFETIVHQDDSYIQYRFDFMNMADGTKEYNIKDYKIVFNIVSEGMPSFKIGDNEAVETLSREYDVYYIIDAKSIIIANYTDFGTGMYFINDKEMRDLSDTVKGAYSFENFSIKDNILKFDAKNYSKDDYRVTLENSIFSVNFDDYTQYVEDDYPMEVTYKYNLNNKDVEGENVVEVIPTKTIQVLYEEITNQYDEVTTSYDETAGDETVDTTVDQIEENVE